MGPDAGYEISIAGYRFDPREPPAELHLEPALDEAGHTREEGSAERVRGRRRAVLVQFVQALTGEDRTRLQREFGLRLSRYLPRFTYLERLDSDTLARLTNDPLVRACIWYQPAFKVAPTIGRVPVRTEARRALAETFLEAVLFDEAEPSEVRDRLADAGARAVVVFDDRPLGGPLRVRFRLADLARLEEIPRIEEVQWIEEVAEMIEDDAGRRERFSRAIRRLTRSGIEASTAKGRSSGSSIARSSTSTTVGAEQSASGWRGHEQRRSRLVRHERQPERDSAPMAGPRRPTGGFAAPTERDRGAMEPRESRLAKNEAVFREVNERVVEITQDLGPGARSAELVDGLICECSDPGCLERVGPLAISQYETVRNDPRRFIIAANHQALDVERVVERNAEYWIVEKLEGVPADVARERDPRN